MVGELPDASPYTQDLCTHDMAERQDSRERVEKEEESDGDGAPEYISLSRGREEALQTRRVTAMEARRATASLKEQRKKREELFKVQKIAKEEKKQLMRFPLTDLKEVLKRRKSGVDETKVVSKSKVTKQKKRKQSKLAPTEHQFGSVKVIALEIGGARPVAANRDTALNFVQQQLYHSRRYKRVPVLSFQAQRYTDRPATNFV